MIHLIPRCTPSFESLYMCFLFFSLFFLSYQSLCWGFVYSMRMCSYPWVIPYIIIPVQLILVISFIVSIFVFLCMWYLCFVCLFFCLSFCAALITPLFIYISFAMGLDLHRRQKAKYFGVKFDEDKLDTLPLLIWSMRLLCVGLMVIGILVF